MDYNNINDKKQIKAEKNRIYQKKFYEAHKDAMKEHANTKMICQCGKTTTLSHKARHQKSKFHNKQMTSLIEDASKSIII